MLATDIQTNPDWHLQRFDQLNNKALLLQLSERQFQEASFLDQRIESQVTQGYWYDSDQLEAAFPSDLPLPQQLGFIFHIGHCGSTLISRVLGSLPDTLVLREPLTLRFLADQLRELDTALATMDQAAWERCRNRVLCAHGRSYHEDQLPIIKASSICNNLLHPLLALSPQYKALLIHVPLRTYLATMLKGAGSLTDVRGFARQRLQDFIRLSPQADLKLFELQEWQLMVLSWVTGMADLLAARQRFEQQTLLIDFDQWLDAVEQGSQAVASLFELDADHSQLSRALSSQLHHYAKKPDYPYSPAQRRGALEQSLQQHADTIAKGLDWAAELAGQHNLSQVLAAGSRE